MSKAVWGADSVHEIEDLGAWRRDLCAAETRCSNGDLPAATRNQKAIVKAALHIAESLCGTPARLTEEETLMQQGIE